MLRPFTLSDAPQVQQLAGDPLVADMTDCLPSPYRDGLAEAWIASLDETFAQGRNATFAVLGRAEDRLVGCVELDFNPMEPEAELSYWLGQPFWGHGYATEACRTALRFAFRDCGLQRVFAYHFTRNPASGSVMRKLGMARERFVAQYPLLQNKREDVIVHGLSRKQYESQAPIPPALVPAMLPMRPASPAGLPPLRITEPAAAMALAH